MTASVKRSTEPLTVTVADLTGTSGTISEERIFWKGPSARGGLCLGTSFVVDSGVAATEVMRNERNKENIVSVEEGSDPSRELSA